MLVTDFSTGECWRRMALFMLLWALFAVPFVASAQGYCPLPQIPTVEIALDIRPPHIDTTQGFARLTAIPNDTRLGLSHDNKVGGLTMGDIIASTQAQFGQHVDYFTGDTCIWVQDLHVLLTLEPVVFIARELPRGSCRQREMLKHEQKHVALDRQILQQSQKPVADNLRLALQRLGAVGPVSPSLARDVQHDLVAQVNQLINAELQRIEQLRNERQQAIDTPAEYARLDAACPDG